MTDDLLDPSWRERLLEAVLAALPSEQDATDPELARFAQLQRDYPERGGKALRGRLLLATAAGYGADPRDALPVAAALELFQHWVLVHDDVEDDSEERRGRPTLHRLVGVPLAVNVGDALHIAMWRMLIELPGPHRDAVLREFADTLAVTAAGQHLDLAWVAANRFDVGPDAYLAMVDRKTATYTVAAPLRLGAVIAGRAPDPAVATVARLLGRAFQIRDDVLNLLPDDSGTYGKEFAGDLYEGKRTLVLAYAFERATKEQAQRLRSLLSRGREGMDAEAVAAILELLHATDAIHDAQRYAERCAEEGMRELQQLGEAMPNRQAAQALFTLAADAASRNA